MRRLAGWSIVVLPLALALLAQDPGPAAATPPAGVAPAVATPPAAHAGARGGEADPGAMFRMARQMDTDGNLLVSEQELKEGFRKFTVDAAAVRADLLVWLDKDGNGVLSPDEWRPFFTAVWMLPLVRSMDQDGDLALQGNEVDAASGRMTEFCRRCNEHTLRQYDCNRDGELSDAEVQTARQAMRRFMPGGRGGAAAPGTGAAAPGTGTAAPGTGAAAPGTGAAAPGTSTAAPGTGGP